MNKTYGYIRVSTDVQAKGGNSLEAQEKAVREAGATVIYSETFTGTRNDRPRLEELLATLEPGDVLVVTKLDRIARTALGGLELLDGLAKKKVRVNILNMGILDDSPQGRLTRTIFLAFAEFERDMIVSRTQEGKAIARRRFGYREGRPRKYTEAALAHAVKLLMDHSYRQVGEITGMSKSTLQRAKREAGARGEANRVLAR